MSGSNVRRERGKGPNGESGTWYVETVRGGPGGYPYERRHFVADTAAPKSDPRHTTSERPWENYEHHSE